ncbi:MAG TPA: hypothetical protein DIU39_10680 [Flavobacteriales bacterium]|nr:hypothetical protein [Flavobacteriales bacterium]|tara:strand:- start:44769 stop:45401 length:633 start_codon:yes stop_codon:yes gene_type:complete
MKNKIVIIFVVLFSFSGLSQQFKPGLIAGINGSQVEGDGYAGYNKAGFVLGGMMRTRLKNFLSAQFEILYIGKGSKKIARPDKGDYDYFLLHLNYIEIPVGLVAKYKTFDFDLGLYYSRRIGKYKLENIFGPVPTYSYPVKKDDFGGYLGISYFFHSNMSFTVRSENSIIPFRKFVNYDQQIGIFNKLFNLGWYNLSLNFTFRYYFYERD